MPFGEFSARGSCVTLVSCPGSDSNFEGRSAGQHGAYLTPTDEDDQDGHFVFTPPPPSVGGIGYRQPLRFQPPREGGATPLPRSAQPLLLLLRSDPPTEGGVKNERGTPQALAASMALKLIYWHYRRVLGQEPSIDQFKGHGGGRGLWFFFTPPRWGVLDLVANINLSARAQ